MAVLHSVNCLFFFVAFVFCSQEAPPTRTVTLRTRLGQITGTVALDYESMGSLYKFYNIPYAKAPIGRLRFAKPQSFGSWRGTLDATSIGPACIQQFDFFLKDLYKRFSEDCLQLNIYVPHNINPTNKKSVMVWIHGGGYQTGSGTIYDGSQISMLGDVIVVTINYRLGFLGFMSLGRHAKGNYGLWDQILALKWVTYNIGDYGGNPNDVTIFGESAGGFSVALQTLIPSNRGLFHRAILQSGTADSFYAYQRSSAASVQIGEKAGCRLFSELGYNQFLECLRSVDAESLVNKTAENRSEKGFSAYTNVTMIPIQDNELFHRDPAVLLMDHSSSEHNFFQSLDIMVGNCDMEGSLLLSAEKLLKDKFNVDFRNGIPKRILCDVIGPNIAKGVFLGSASVSDAICQKYTAHTTSAEQSMTLLNMFTDLFFLSGSLRTLRSHANSIQGRNTYQYIFSETKLTYVFSGGNDPSWYSGSGHGTELIYLFFKDFVRSKNVSLSAEDVKFADQLTSYWTNFAKTGDPNGPGLPRWLPYDQSSNHLFMQLNSHNMSTGYKYRESWADFWIQDIPKIASIKPITVGK